MIDELAESMIEAQAATHAKFSRFLNILASGIKFL
jgi:hypothetical protein